MKNRNRKKQSRNGEPNEHGEKREKEGKETSSIEFGMLDIAKHQLNKESLDLI